MSADMESIMGGYNDPRMSSYFKTSVKYPGEYKGIRTGGIMGDKTVSSGLFNLW